jgi:hypothetical protein
VAGGSVCAQEISAKIQKYVMKTFVLLAIKRFLDVLNAQVMKVANHSVKNVEKDMN